MRRVALSLTTLALLVSGLIAAAPAAAIEEEPLQPPEPFDGVSTMVWCSDRGFVLMVIDGELYCVYVDEITVTG